MKNTFKILLAACFAFGLATSCNDDEDYVAVDPVANMVKVVSRNTSLPAAASQGEVVVEAEGSVTATTTAQGWLTTTVSGNRIILNADFNPSYESRVAVLNIKSGTKETEMSVIQEGIILDLGGVTTLGTSSDDACTFEIPMKTNCNLEFNSDADWISASVEDGVLSVKFTQNTTGHVRRGNLTYKAGPIEGTIPATQYDFNKDVAGDYELRYSNSAKTANYKKACTVSKTSTGYNCHVVLSATEEYDIPLAFDPGKCRFTVNSASYCGTYAEKDAFAIILGHNAENGLYNTTSTSVGMSADVVYSAADNATVASFADNGSWSGMTAKAVYIRTFNTNPPSGSAVSTRVQFWFPTLFKADAE